MVGTLEARLAQQEGPAVEVEEFAGRRTGAAVVAGGRHLEGEIWG
jgi:hypothetical protein